MLLRDAYQMSGKRDVRVSPVAFSLPIVDMIRIGHTHGRSTSYRGRMRLRKLPGRWRCRVGLALGDPDTVFR